MDDAKNIEECGVPDKTFRRAIAVQEKITDDPILQPIRSKVPAQQKRQVDRTSQEWYMLYVEVQSVLNEALQRCAQLGSELEWIKKGSESEWKLMQGHQEQLRQ
jgi:hypothetical protein